MADQQDSPPHGHAANDDPVAMMTDESEAGTSNKEISSEQFAEAIRNLTGAVPGQITNNINTTPELPENGLPPPPPPHIHLRPVAAVHAECNLPTLATLLEHGGPGTAAAIDPLHTSFCICSLGLGTLRGCAAISQSYRHQLDPAARDFSRALGTILFLADHYAAAQGLDGIPVLQRLASALRSWGQLQHRRPIPDLSLAYVLRDGVSGHIPGYETGRHVWIRVNSFGDISEGAAQKVEGYFEPIRPSLHVPEGQEGEGGQ